MQWRDNGLLPWVDSVGHALIEKVYQGSHHVSTTGFDELVSNSVTSYRFTSLEFLDHPFNLFECDRGVKYTF